jgi:hypothetical protein
MIASDGSLAGTGGTSTRPAPRRLRPLVWVRAAVDRLEEVPVAALTALGVWALAAGGPVAGVLVAGVLVAGVLVAGVLVAGVLVAGALAPDGGAIPHTSQ